MTKKLAGPFLALVKKPKDPIGLAPCLTGKHMREVRVNANGYTYQFCVGADSCGQEVKASNMDMAREMISRITTFERGMKRKTLEMAGLIEPKDTPTELEPITENSDPAQEPELKTDEAAAEPEPEPDAPPKSKARKGVKFTVFGRAL